MACNAPVRSENRHLEDICLLNFKSCGQPWSCRTTFSTILRSGDEKRSKMILKWRVWATFWTALASFWDSLRWLSCHLAGFVACFCQVLGHFMGKSLFFVNRHHSRADWLLLQVRASRLEPTGPKRFTRTVQSDLEGQGQSGQDRQVWPVGSVLLSELWKAPRRSPKSSQARSQRLSKRQDI